MDSSDPTLKKSEKYSIENEVTVSSSDEKADSSFGIDPPSGTKQQDDLTILIQGNEILAKKIKLVNDAIDAIGFTPYHWKLFVLTGLGYGSDILLMMLVNLTQIQANKEFGKSFPGGPMAVAAGSTLGCLFWGSIGDVFGRKLTFNISLFMAAVMSLICAGMPNYVGYCIVGGLAAFFVSGNLILDGVVFLEFLPSSHSYMVIVLTYWWTLSQTITTLYCWPLLEHFSCNPVAKVICKKIDNMGWRYCWIISGGIVLIFSILRFFFIKLVETPRYSLVSNREDELIKNLETIAASANKTNTLTRENLDKCGLLNDDYAAARKSFNATRKLIWMHVKATFQSVKMTYSVILLQVIWLLNGFAYPLYTTFLPYYLMTRGAASDTFNLTYRHNAIVAATGIVGQIFVTLMVIYFPKFGKRGIMVIGSILVSIFLFCYTRVRNQAQNIGFNCAVYISIRIAYTSLFTYTPEVLPSQFRSTWTSICISWSRFGGIISPLVAYYTDVSSNVPLFLCASLFLVIALLSAILPYESVGRRIV